MEWVASGSVVSGTHYKFSGPEDAADLVILVHGIGSYHNCFDDVASAISAKGYRTLQYDLIGRGFSNPSPDGKYDAVAHISQLEQLVLDLGIDRFHLVGHSMGGALATLYTARNSGKVKSLTLIAPAGLMDSFPLSLARGCLQGAVKSLLSSRSGQEKAWRDDFFHHTGQSKEREDEKVASLHAMYDNNKEAANAFFRSVVEFPLYGIDSVVSSIGLLQSMPILIMWGKADKAVPYSNAKRWTKLLKRGGHRDIYLWSRSTAGHGMMMEFHEDISEEVLNFFSFCRSKQAGQNITFTVSSTD